MSIFDDVSINPFITGMKILVCYREYWKKNISQASRRIVRPFLPKYQLAGYFDGAANDGASGCGFILYINKDHFYRGWMGIDTCTNNLSELSALWSLLY